MNDDALRKECETFTDTLFNRVMIHQDIASRLLAFAKAQRAEGVRDSYGNYIDDSLR